jgi:hypothetical protein
MLMGAVETTVSAKIALVAETVSVPMRKTLFSHQNEKILLPFRFEAKMMAVFRFSFVLFSLRSIFVSVQISTFRIDAK